ncbi:hypothetical protein NW752_012234 [Fusarium irregulare]|nr:hypothetical protein NW752_012234 [Fusarium irregulare]
MPTTISLYNQGQCDQAFEGAIALISDTLVTPNDIVMITPYRGNLECLENIRKVKSKDNPDIANTTINTTDSFQGREGRNSMYTRVTAPGSRGVAHGQAVMTDRFSRQDKAFDHTDQAHHELPNQCWVCDLVVQSFATLNSHARNVRPELSKEEIERMVPKQKREAHKKDSFLP